MSVPNKIAEFQDFKEFYTKVVLPLKKEHSDYIRLDGKIAGSTRNVSGYFWYQNIKWKVDADTYIDRLKLAFEAAEKSDEPFVIKNTREGRCLEIKGQPIRNKKFYVYKVAERTGA